jgi:multiple sugar transport system permease protein
MNNSLSAKHKKIRNEVTMWLLLLPLAIIMYLWVWRPTIMGMVWSTFKMKGYTPQEFIGLKNYIDVVTDTEFIPILFNTLKYVFWSLVVGFIPPIAIAIILNELIHFKNTFRIIIYLPAVIPGVAANLMWYFMYYPDETGLLNKIIMSLGGQPYIWLNDPKFSILFIIISMTWHGFGSTMILYYAALQSVPADLYEAATIDGAGILKKAFNITLPQIGGVVLLSLVNQIIAVFQVLDQPMVMTGGGPNGASTSIGYQLYKYGFVSGRTGHAMALGVIIFFILLLMTIFYFRMNKKIEENY